MIPGNKPKSGVTINGDGIEAANEHAETILRGGRLVISKRPQGYAENLQRYYDFITQDRGDREFTEAEKHQMARMSESIKVRDSVRIFAGQFGGGSVDVMNPHGETVGSLQSNKANAGLLYLSDAAGKPQRAISAD